MGQLEPETESLAPRPSETLSDRIWQVDSPHLDVRRRGRFLILLQLVSASVVVVSMPLAMLAGVPAGLADLGVALSTCLVCALGIWATRRGHVDLLGLVVSTLVNAALVGGMLRQGSTAPFGWLAGIPVLIAAFSVRPHLVPVAWAIAQAALVGVELAGGVGPRGFEDHQDAILMSFMLVVVAATSMMHSSTNERVLEQSHHARQVSDEARFWAEQALLEAARSQHGALLLDTAAEEPEEARERRLADLATAPSARSRLASAAAHREPRHVVIGPPSTLREPAPARPLQLPWVEPPPSRVEVGLVAIEPLLRQTIAEHGPAARRRGNVIRAWLEEGLGTITTDGGRLRRILALLLSNAVELTDGGEVHVRASRVASPVGLRIEIEDTGAGIAPEHLDRIFGGFEQAGAWVPQRYGSVAASRALCRTLGGDVRVRSTQGEGSTFTILLPAEPPAGVASAVSA